MVIILNLTIFRTVSNDLHAKTNHMYQNQGAAQGGGGAAALEAQALNNEIRNSLNDLKQNIQQLVNRPQVPARFIPSHNALVVRQIMKVI